MSCKSFDLIKQELRTCQYARLLRLAFPKSQPHKIMPVIKHFYIVLYFQCCNQHVMMETGGQVCLKLIVTDQNRSFSFGSYRVKRRKKKCDQFLVYLNVGSKQKLQK
jgi:hypothetical protein